MAQLRFVVAIFVSFLFVFLFFLNPCFLCLFFLDGYKYINKLNVKPVVTYLAVYRFF